MNYGCKSFNLTPIFGVSYFPLPTSDLCGIQFNTSSDSEGEELA